MQINKLIDYGSSQLKDKKISSHKLDSEILLSKVLRKTREELLINSENKISSKKISQFNKLLKRREKREPIAYILKEKEFWSKIFVNQKVFGQGLKLNF